jgi:hypothetical protein
MQRRRLLGRLAAAGVCTALLVMPGGCGSGEPGVVPVRGKVTLDGGPWPKEGTITFTPVAGAQGADPSKARPGTGKFATDGSFTVTSFEAGDGLFPGQYEVSVECLDSAPTMGNDGRVVGGKSSVPEKYRNGSTSGLALTVKPGERVTDATFDVKTK